MESNNLKDKYPINTFNNKTQDELVDFVKKENLEKMRIATEIFMTEIVGYYIENIIDPPKYIDEIYGRLMNNYKERIKELEK